MFRLLSAVTALFGLSTAATVKDCGGGTGLFTINSLGLDPVSPTPGQEITLNLDYTVPEGLTVTDGTTRYDITLNFIPFSPSTNPLCQDIPCPLGPGHYVNATKSTWPSGVSGSFTSKMTWTDQDGQKLLCVAISGALQTPLLLAPPPPWNETEWQCPLDGGNLTDTVEDIEDREPEYERNATEESGLRLRGGRRQ